MSARTHPSADAMPLALKWGMAVLAVYTVNMLHLPSSLGVPGLNVLNLICIVILIMHSMSKRSSEPLPPLARRIFLLLFMIVYAFLIAQITLPANLLLDITLMKASLFYPLYFFMFYYIVRTEDDIRFLLAVILVVALVAGLEAVREGLDYGNTSFHPMKRASGPFGVDAFTANRAGIFFAMFFALALAVALYHPDPGNRWIRPLALVSIVVLFGGVFYTFSRQSYLIVGVIAALMMMRRGPALCIILVIVGLNYSLWLPQAALDRLTDTQQVNEEGEEEVDESTESRWVQWEAAGGMVADKPWGVGLHRFAVLSESYGGKADLDAHNHYFLFAAEASPLGLLVHLVLVISLWNLGRRLDRLAKHRKDALGRTLGTGFAFVTIAMILGNIYGSPFSNGEVMGLYWALGGLAARRLVTLQSPARASVDVAAAGGGMGGVLRGGVGAGIGAPGAGNGPVPAGGRATRQRRRTRGRDLSPDAAGAD